MCMHVRARSTAIDRNDSGRHPVSLFDLIVCPYQFDVNDANGKVMIQTYWSGSGAENQGTAKVMAICQRLSVNLPAGVSGD